MNINSRAALRGLKPLLAAAVFSIGAFNTAGAAVLNAEVASNAYITIGGFDWAWASPIHAVDLSYQSQFGWRLATQQELNSAPLATDFIFTGANVALGGTDPVSGAHFSATNSSLTGAAACAAAYFSTYRHCDWQDGNGQYGFWAGTGGNFSWSADALVLRATAVPGPIAGAGLPALMALGGFVWARRRKAALPAA